MESDYDKHGDFYYDFVHSGDPEKHQTVEVIVGMLGDVTQSEICDLACGEGFFSRLLARRGARVTGIDISRNLLDHARRQSEGLSISYVRDDARYLSSMAAGSFDAVVCNMALMDISELEPTCHSVHRILRPGGAFLFSILHPCFATPFNADNPPAEEDAEGNFIASRVTRYGSEGRWFSDGSGMCGTLGSVHRKLSTYVNALSQAGFVIQQMQEPLLPEGDYQTPGEQMRSIVPQFLVAQTAKAMLSPRSD